MAEDTVPIMAPIEAGVIRASVSQPITRNFHTMSQFLINLAMDAEVSHNTAHANQPTSTRISRRRLNQTALRKALTTRDIVAKNGIGSSDAQRAFAWAPRIDCSQDASVSSPDFLRAK